MGLDVPIKHMPYFLQTPKKSDDSPEQTPINRRPFFLFVGRLEFIKGVQNIIPSFKKQDEFDLLIAGEGSYRGELEKQAGGDERIKFLGGQTQDQLKRLYESAIAVIVPSICYETFGIIVIEAFSRKTPVIVNDLGALPEVVKESGGGYVYGDTDQLEAAMKTLAGDRQLRNSLGMKGYFAFLRNWNETAHLDKYLGLVNELLEKSANTVTVEVPQKVLAIGAS
jgi:glycosyltransferase involved in cell wall biosynthesis